MPSPAFYSLWRREKGEHGGGDAVFSRAVCQSPSHGKWLCMTFSAGPPLSLTAVPAAGGCGCCEGGAAAADLVMRLCGLFLNAGLWRQCLFRAREDGGLLSTWSSSDRLGALFRAGESGYGGKKRKKIEIGYHSNERVTCCFAVLDSLYGFCGGGGSAVGCGRGDTFSRALETISSQVKDSEPCKKVVKELNREADRLEQLWRKAFLSGFPSTQEWCRMADMETRLFRRIAESRGQEKREKVVFLSELEDDGVITHEETEAGFAALRRLMWVSKTAIDSLDDFIAGAELPLPSSPDGDSYEKLLAWKSKPESSLSYAMDHDPLVNGRLEETLQCCWDDGVLGLLERTVSRISRERRFLLVRHYADRQVEEAERLSRLPYLTPEQWCWFQKREHDRENLERSTVDLLTVALLFWNKGKETREAPLMEETFRYWISTPERIAQVWREKLRKEEKR